MRYFIAAMIFLTACTTLPAQWLKIKTPGPRKADGKTVIQELSKPALISPRIPGGVR